MEIEHTSEDWTARVEVECLYEWGEGKTEREAIGDLVSSLGEYKLSLMDYKDELGDCPARDLELLKDMVT